MIYFWQVDIMIWQVDIKNEQVIIRIWQVDIIISQVMAKICHHSHLTDERLQIKNNISHSWLLNSDGPFWMVIFEEPWHLSLLPSVWHWHSIPVSITRVFHNRDSSRDLPHAKLTLYKLIQCGDLLCKKIASWSFFYYGLPNSWVLSRNNKRLTCQYT